MDKEKFRQIKMRGWYLHLKYGRVIAVTLLLLLVIRVNLHAQELAIAWEVNIISEEEEQEIMKECTGNSSMINTHQVDLMLNGVMLPHDVSRNRYYVSQNIDVDGWEGILTTNSDKVKLYLLEDDYLGDKKSAIEEGHVFRVLLKKGDEYALTNLVATGMPIVSIDTKYSREPDYTEDDIDNFVFNSDTRYYGNITIYNADGSSGTYTAPEMRNSTAAALSGKLGAKIQEKIPGKNYRILQHQVCYHGRGATSAGFDKKGYALKLIDEDEKKVTESLFQLGFSSKWKLLSIPADQYKIREKTAWQLWAEMAETAEDFREYTSAAEYCELIMDGEYRGLYLLIKTFDETSLGLEDEDILYKIIQAEMPAKDEIEASVEQEYPVCYPIRMRYPDLDEISVEQAWEPMKHYLDVSLWHTSFPDYYESVELDNLIDFTIFLETVTASDNARKNTYMVADQQEDGSYKMITLPWDLDNTFGNNFDNNMDIGKTKFNPDTSVIYTEGVTRQLFINNEHGEKDRLIEKWENYRQNILSDEHIFGIMQDNMDYLVSSGAFARDEEKWPEFGHTSDLTKIMEYQKERMAFLDDYFTAD